MVRDKKETNIVLFKVGVAIAISLGGMFYSFSRHNSKNMKNSSLSRSASGFEDQVDKEGIKTLVNDENSDTTENQEGFGLIANSLVQNGNKDPTLSAEYEEIVNDFNMASDGDFTSPMMDVETLFKFESEFEHSKREEYEEEIENLRNRVEFLQKRVTTLESELLKYYGLKEQERIIKELKNRVKIHNTEAKLYNLKLEALQVDNRKLKEQMVDYSKIVSELAASKETIDLLKKKLKAETEQNKKQLLGLQERVKKMQEHDLEAVLGVASTESMVKKIKELEEELEELRRCNNSFGLENLELAHKLKQSQISASSLQEDLKVETLQTDYHNLRQKNEELLKQIEHLQSSWFADIEELVYLRWINACLRYEVRNYQPEPGKTSSRDLSKTVSPKSEEKAKQLIMEYANKHGLEEKGRHIIDSDFDQWSFSQFSNSNHSDNGEIDDESSLDHSSANKTDSSGKKRIFSKLRRLLRGEEEYNHSTNHDGSSWLEETNNNDSQLYVPETNGDHTIMRKLNLGSGRFVKVLKLEELKELESRRRNSDIGISRVSKNLVFGREDVGEMTESLDENLGLAEDRSKLLKYAEVLKDSLRENPKSHRRAVSHC